ncbi:hypothetical protein N7456_012040, partial [Penicillium angulare]
RSPVPKGLRKVRLLGPQRWTLQKHQITNRVLSITTDNASNKTEMIQAVQELAGLRSSAFPLSLHDLLGKLSAEEQRQVDYLILITKPFFDMTNTLLRTHNVTAHSIFSIYNRLFNQFNAAEEKLERKGILWNIRMLQALRAAKVKLRECDIATDT